jgi:putative membrane protein (TIGR04086 family)
MRAGWRAWLHGVAVSLAVAFPATIVAQVLDAVRDDDLPVVATVGLSLIVLAGPVVGAFAAGRQRRSRWGLRGITIGATCLLLIAVFGAIRQAAADEDPVAFAIPVLAIVGGALGLVGDRAAAAARRRS